MKAQSKWQLFIVLLALAIAMPAAGTTDWKITFQVSGVGVNGICKAGVNELASDGRDYVYDVRAMLGSLNSNYAFCYFPHPEWNDIATDFFKEDIQAPAPGQEKQWTLEVYSNIDGELTLQWPDLQQKLVGFEAYITDVDGSGETFDMQSTTSFLFSNIVDDTRQFQITIIEPADPEQDTLWADVKRLRVSLEWMQTDDPAAAGYYVWRKFPNESFKMLNQHLIQPGKEFYLDKIQKKMLQSIVSSLDIDVAGQLVTIPVVYKVETVAIEPPGQVIKESNEVEVHVQFGESGKRDTRLR